MAKKLRKHRPTPPTPPKPRYEKATRLPRSPDARAQKDKRYAPPDSEAPYGYTSDGIPRELPLKTDVPRHAKEFDPAAMCGAQMRRRPEGTLCQNLKGFRTPHPGEGRCFLHGGCTPITTGLSSLVRHGRLRDMLEQIHEIDHQLMDLRPEIELMRAMVIDYVNRYDLFVEQLETWYNWNDIERVANGMPPLPRRIPDLESAGSLLEAITRMMERAHKIEREGSITLDVFRGIMGQMGMIVAANVQSSAELDAIERGWAKILVAPRAFVKESTENTDDIDDEPVPGV